MNKQHSPLLKKDATQSILASILSIIIGLMVGCIIILIVGLTSDNLTLSSALDGIQLIFGGLFSTGRDAAGNLTFGFNPTNIGNMLFRATPLIMTGLSVAVAFKTGLFNIGAPGHSWQITSCAGMSIGEKGMLYGAKVLAATAVKLAEDPELVKKAQEEFKTNMKGKTYKCPIPKEIPIPQPQK